MSLGQQRGQCETYDGVFTADELLNIGDNVIELSGESLRLRRREWGR